MPGNMEMFELFATTDDVRFAELMTERQVSFVLDVGPDGMAAQIRLACLVLYGWEPNDPKTKQRIPQTSLWRFLQSRKSGIVRSQTVALFAPSWRVISVPPTFDLPAAMPAMAPPPGAQP